VPAIESIVASALFLPKNKTNLTSSNLRKETSMNNHPNHRIRSLVGKVLVFLPGVVVLMSGVVKLIGVPGVVHQMATMGFTGGRYTLVGTLELLCAGTFLYPRSRSLGLLLLSAFLGGAICVHVQTAEIQKAIGPAILLAQAWAGTWLRHPEVFWSWTKTYAASGKA